MGAEHAAFQVGPGAGPPGGRQDPPRGLRQGLEPGRREEGPAAHGGVYHWHRTRRPGHDSGRDLMTHFELAGIAATCPLFRGLTEADTDELIALFEIETFT